MKKKTLDCTVVASDVMNNAIMKDDGDDSGKRCEDGGDRGKWCSEQ